VQFTADRDHLASHVHDRFHHVAELILGDFREFRPRDGRPQDAK
jgi:hypothetical protein